MRSPRSLTGRAHFAHVLSHGQRARSDGLTVWALPRPGAGEVRLGLAVSAREGGAVIRNRWRRRMRSLVRHEAGRPADIVVRADRVALELSFQDLEGNLRAALQATRVNEP